MKKGFTLIELMVVVAVIGVLIAVLVPQVTNFVYKARVTAAATSLKNFKMALDLLINDIGFKPPAWGAVYPANDELALMKRNSCPNAFKSQWNGPYIHNYPVSTVSSLFAYSDRFWYYYNWPRSDAGTAGNWCGTGYGILLHTAFINRQAKVDVENALLGKVDPWANNWLYWCGFHDDRQVAHW